MSNSYSERITILRPLLIVLIVSTHIQGNLYRIDLKDIPLQAVSFMHALLSGSLAASALPLLSVISGYLAGHTFRRYSYSGNILKKVDRIIIPMLAWNFLAATYVVMMQGKGVLVRADIPLVAGGLEAWFYALTGFFRLPANQPLYFLRELFLCFLLTPVLMRLVRSRLLTLGCLLGVAYLSVTETNFHFFHRIDIYGFFVIGLFICQHSERIGKIKFYREKWFQLTYLAVFALLATALTLYGFQANPERFLLLRKGLTLFGPLALWMVGEYISGGVKKTLVWLSPASFTIFLGHILFLNLYWNTWIAVFKSSPLRSYYGWYWLTAMVFCVLSMVALSWAWKAYLRRQVGVLGRS